MQTTKIFFMKVKGINPHFRVILSFSRLTYWLSCCAHGGFFMCLGVEEWGRWTTWDRAQMWGGDGHLVPAIS